MPAYLASAVPLSIHFLLFYVAGLLSLVVVPQARSRCDLRLRTVERQ